MIDVNDLGRMVKRELDQLKDWFAINKLSLNVAKTNYMLFSRCINAVDITVMVNIAVFIYICVPHGGASSTRVRFPSQALISFAAKSWYC